MNPTEDPNHWQQGYQILRERVDRLPATLRKQAGIPIEPLDIPPETVRCFVTSGVGSSEAHARFLTHLLSTEFGLSSRFTPLTTLAAGPLKGSEHDVLILFSQGLSPNARLALRTCSTWKKTILATAVTDAGTARHKYGYEHGHGHQPQPQHDPKQAVLRQISEAGGRIIRFLEEDEYTTLIRVVGPMAGYLCALQLARAIAVHPPTATHLSLTQEVESICAALETSEGRLHEALSKQKNPSISSSMPLIPLNIMNEIALITCGDYGEIVGNLRYKILEGIFSSLPPVWDLLHFAHGPFQQIYNKNSVFLALTQPHSNLEQELLQRMKEMLVPERHTLIELPSHLPGILSIFDHEAMLNHLVLKIIREQEIDQISWSGKGLDAPLYNVGASDG